MQIRLPVIANEGKLQTPDDMDFEIQQFTLMEIDDTVSTQYFATNEMAVPNLYQRTIYRKGRTESARVGMLLVDLQQGRYSLKVDDPLTRPAGLDIQLTLKLTTKE